MAKIDLTSKDWCELIFKDRNKEYGAYDMRLDTPKRHNLATLIVIVVVILVITLPMLIKFITPEKENKIVVNEVTTLAKLPEAEIKRNEELQPMMKPTTPPPPLKSTIKFTAPVIKKDEEVGEEDEIKSQDELAARGNVAISIADVKGNDEIDGQDIADFKDFVAPEVEEEEVYIIVEQMPGFPGGEEALLKYISDHIEYPTMAVERGIEGRVTVRFVVNKDGYVQDVTVIRGVHELLDKEAVRVIQSLPRWNPGKQNGVAVAVYYNVPVNFTLQ
ncbi:MAG TPA: energy transducer TonB [Porphyromonadaceae bacterium]|jgi:tonB family C-terminal domain|uniref:Energy transducer TonB n=1 Tax=Candidatus Caccoplasma intestinavium TaxID=2840716 RepID=A0A9D1GEU4_9BACT|nr:energy transducer TonB [Barnesiella sp.]CDA21564.1 tonB family domain-containing protein [Bacteroides sp. CAG:144]HCZ21356.1 energy transducer TonB [Porphyromonadaceae bacterium]HIT39827.1 energy transducer TonB [Candidatus Caccoplasma intestinavium]